MFFRILIDMTVWCIHNGYYCPFLDANRDGVLNVIDIQVWVNLYLMTAGWF